MASVEFIYTDESGTNYDRSNYCIVAGYQGTAGQFETLRREWTAVLKRSGVVGDFHADLFFNRMRWTRSAPNQFVGWPETRAARLLGGLLHVISTRRIVAVGAAIPVEAFNSLEYGERCLLVGYVPPSLLADPQRIRIRNPEPYMLAYSMTLTGVMESVPDDTKLHFRIARHQQYGPRAVEYFSTMKEALGSSDVLHEIASARKMHDMSQQSPADEPAIQAADLLAYLWHRSMQVGGDAGLTDTERESFIAIRGKPNRLSWALPEQLDDLLNAHGADQRAMWRTIRPPRGVSR